MIAEEGMACLQLRTERVLTLLGCATSRANGTTATQDSDTGLHVDNFDRLPYARRHRSRRRLCLNLGPSPRYLLIGDRDIQRICRPLHPAPEQHYPRTEDIRCYVNPGHPLRCLRIHLAPGEG